MTPEGDDLPDLDLPEEFRKGVAFASAVAEEEIARLREFPARCEIAENQAEWLRAENDRLQSALRSRTRQRNAARAEVAQLRRHLGLYAAPVVADSED